MKRAAKKTFEKDPKPKTAKKAPKKPTGNLRTKAEKIKKAEKILDLYSAGNYTLESCCNEEGITARTLENWSQKYSEISALKKQAKDNNGRANRQGIQDTALYGLKRLITGYYVDEEEVEQLTDSKGRLVSTRSRKKSRYVQPATAAIIFALKNVDPINWNEDKFQEINAEPQVFRIGNQTITF